MGDKMKKINIVKSKYDFDQIIKTGKTLKSKYFVINYKINEDDKNNTRFGITISKKNAIAVERNRIKRQVKSIIDKNNYNKGFKYIIIIRKEALFLSYQDLKKSLIDLLTNVKGEIDEKEKNW